MTTRRASIISSTLATGRPVLITLILAAMVWSASSQHVSRSAGNKAPGIRQAASPGAASLAVRQRFLEMFARAYFPGRTGQLLIVPREGDFITRPDPDVAYMHGSPWAYDVSIPLMFAGPAVRTGVYSMPAVQQDVAPTLAAALGVSMPPTATGRVLPILRTGFARPRVVFVLVLDGMRRDYFDRYADVMPTLSALRRRAAWFSQAHVNFLPSNTAVGHSTISTGTDPSIHGVTVNNIYDRLHRRRQDLFAGMMPQALMALTLADVWQLSTSGRAIVLAQGSIDRAATPLAGHGACQPNGARVVLVSYDQETGAWHSNPDCFRLPDYLKDRNASTLWSAESEWLHHRIDSPATVRRSALFPAFEADAMTAMIGREPVGEDGVADLLLLNYKGADFVGHRYGPDSNELRLTLGEMDRNLARIIATLEAKVGQDYLLAVTADHGMPSAPPERRHLAPAVVDLLHQKFDPQAKQLVTAYEPENAQMFVDENRLSLLGLTLGDLARFLEAQPFVFSVFTHDDVRRAAEAANHVTPTRLLGATEVVGQQGVTALDRTLWKTHMRQDTTYVTIADAPVQAFAPTTIECGKRSCTVRVEVSSQFFNVTSGNAVRLHVKADGAPFPVTGFEIDGGINRPVAHLTTVSSLKSDLSPGPHTISVDFDMRSPGGKAEASIRTLTIQVFTP